MTIRMFENWPMLVVIDQQKLKAEISALAQKQHFWQDV